ncbi:transcriptional repressor NrdR [Candidatus Daviesbacteria bacterium]|nr:transcriptional repressor NrdR [Candidatus Daviesbacteria bacterium]
MRCPFCSASVSRVIDKRAVLGSGEIRRRRECLKCSRRFTTYERLANFGLVVVKKDGRKEIFDREKLKAGLLKALEKRPAIDKVDFLTDRIERRLWRRKKAEVASKLIGSLVLVELKKVDTIAYLRFASVYRQFEKPEDFAKELLIIEGYK